MLKDTTILHYLRARH